MSCDCEFSVDPDEPNEEPWHYLRTCERCDRQWYGLHCPHDGIQNPCPHCGATPHPRIDVTRDARGRAMVANWPKPRVSNPNFLSEELAAHHASIKNDK